MEMSYWNFPEVSFENGSVTTTGYNMSLGEAEIVKRQLSDRYSDYTFLIDFLPDDDFSGGVRFISISKDTGERRVVDLHDLSFYESSSDKISPEEEDFKAIDWKYHNIPVSFTKVDEQGSRYFLTPMPMSLFLEEVDKEGKKFIKEVKPYPKDSRFLSFKTSEKVKIPDRLYRQVYIY